MVEQRFAIKQHSGPLPSPEVMHQYDQIVPGAAERILQMAERQQAHRHAIETKDLDEGAKYAKRGQYMATTAIFASLIVGTYLALSGYAVVASILLGSTLVGVVASFIGSRVVSAAPNKQGK